MHCALGFASETLAPEIVTGTHLDSKCTDPVSGLKKFPNKKGKLNCGHEKLITQELKKNIFHRDLKQEEKDQKNVALTSRNGE